MSLKKWGSDFRCSFKKIKLKFTRRMKKIQEKINVVTVKDQSALKLTAEKKPLTFTQTSNKN